jgi:hypothetical protein
MSRTKKTEPIMPLTPRKSPDPEDTPLVAGLLQEVAEVCAQMRDHEKAVIALGKRRRQLVTRLRDRKVTWRKIAEWAGTTDQALYKHHNRAD